MFATSHNAVSVEQERSGLSVIEIRHAVLLIALSFLNEGTLATMFSASPHAMPKTVTPRKCQKETSFVSEEGPPVWAGNQ